MTSEEIKTEVNSLCQTIKQSEDRLLELRKQCPHTNTEIKPYSYRVGSLTDAKICIDCGECLIHDMDLYKLNQLIERRNNKSV